MATNDIERADELDELEAPETGDGELSDKDLEEVAGGWTGEGDGGG